MEWSRRVRVASEATFQSRSSRKNDPNAPRCSGIGSSAQQRFGASLIARVAKSGILILQRKEARSDQIAPAGSPGETAPWPTPDAGRAARAAGSVAAGAPARSHATRVAAVTHDRSGGV